MHDRRDRARAGGLALGALLLLLVGLAWYAGRPAAPTPVPLPVTASPTVAPGRPRPLARPGPEPADEAPVTMDPPAEVRRTQVAALGALADAAGLTVVECPGPQGLGDHSYTHPGLFSVGSPTGHGQVFAVEQPEGAVPIRKGGGLLEETSEVVAVLRWGTGPDGQPFCRQEPPSPRPLRIRVVDRDGRPVSGAYVQVDRVPSGVTGSGGVAEVTSASEAPTEVRAFTEQGYSDVEWVAPSTDATLVITHGGPTPEEMQAAIDAIGHENQDAKRRDLEAALATPDLPPELREVLEGWAQANDPPDEDE